MIDTIYIEREVAAHPETLRVLQRFPRARRIEIDRYGEIFNRRAQSFRLQKLRPALILARKHDRFVLEAPAEYGVGGEHNYYFSHLLNCIYDCRYCFLQGMYRSANYVYFVNLEEFERAIDEALARHPGEPVYFFSGYDCDSLALDGVTGFAGRALDFFAERPGGWLELRTKSVRTRALLERSPLTNVIVAMSFTPESVHGALEHGVPAVERRLCALAELGRRGWPLGLRFDPLIYFDGYADAYRALFDQIAECLDRGWLHSVCFGSFRLPKPFFDRVRAQYPDEALFAGPLEQCGNLISYRSDLERQMRAFCAEELAARWPAERLFACQ